MDLLDPVSLKTEFDLCLNGCDVISHIFEESGLYDNVKKLFTYIANKRSLVKN